MNQQVPYVSNQKPHKYEAIRIIMPFHRMENHTCFKQLFQNVWMTRPLVLPTITQFRSVWRFWMKNPFASIVHLCPIFRLPFWRKPNTSRFTNPFSSDLFTTDRPAAVRSLRRNHRACGQNQPNLFSHGDRKQVVKPRDEWSAAGRFKSEKQPWVKICKIM